MFIGEVSWPVPDIHAPADLQAYDGALIWSLDQGFDRMHRAGLLQAFEPAD